jgi:hypothetical protein
MATTELRAPSSATYAQLEERVLARDQVGASQVYYELIKAGRPVAEIAGELVRIHAPYTHVPFHQRLDDGVPKFVNNDHCLLSIRASYRLMPLVSAQIKDLPLAQSTWYIPSGLDPWNQLLGKAPGHYARMYDVKPGEAKLPQVHWPDQEPEHLDVPHREGLNEWLTRVQRGEVLPAYRAFLGLLQNEEHRTETLAQLAFAGLIDVQDRMLYNRSYTTGHKSYRARATIEIGNLVGWDNAHNVVYAGVPDMAVGPRWYSTYEMACNVAQEAFEGTDHDLLRNTTGFTDAEAQSFIDVLNSARDHAKPSISSSSRPLRTSSTRTIPKASACRSMRTSIATRCAGSSTNSTIHTRPNCCISPRPSSTERLTTRPARQATVFGTTTAASMRRSTRLSRRSSS